MRVGEFLNRMVKSQMNKLVLGLMAVAGGFIPVGAHGQAENFLILHDRESATVPPFAEWVEWTDLRNMLQHHLNSQAFQLIQEREKKIERLQTAEDWAKRKREVKALLQRIVGPFPDRTPLNTRVLGVIPARGYKVEKVVFESRPRFFVTADLFVPALAGGRRPAVIYLSGHNDLSFRNEGAQVLILNLVRKGFNVLAIDPLSMGERLQYYDPAQKKSLIGGPSAEHDYFGRQCFLAGVSSARYFVWDIMRGIDYLASRPDVDETRIGVTGNSGGGTQTAYIGAMDERVKAAAPSCYITSFRRLLQWMGPQDAEQNFVGGIASGLDHADLLEVRAPAATLVVTTTRDGFSIQGARETFAEAKRAYRAMGAEENLVKVEDDYDHGYSFRNREAIYAFFQKHLNNPGDPKEENVDDIMLSRDELRVTATGQVIDALGGETVFSINRTETGTLLERLEHSRQDITAHLETVRKSAKELSGYTAPSGVSGLMFMGGYRREGYRVEMYVMSGEGNCVLPFLLMVPESQHTHPALIYLHPKGKADAAERGGEMEWFVKRGYSVLAPDLSGTGELGSVNDETSYLGLQIRRSIVGIRAGDVVRCVEYLKTRNDIDKGRILGLAREGLGAALLHAAVFEPSISGVALIEPLISYRSVATNRFYRAPYADLVTSALTAYDLPDLAACLAPRRLLVLNATDQLLVRATTELIESEFAVVRAAFSKAEAQSNLVVRNWEPYQRLDEVFAWWLKQ